VITEAPIDAPAPRKRHSLLPLLTVLFLISYGLMTMLIVEQGSTIESQRALIRELFRDSQELSASKLKKNSASSRVQAPASKAQGPAIAQNPDSSPLTQDHTPSSQALAQPGVQKQAQKPFHMPSKPASDLNDSRRALRTI
jgi:hypothetical protein